MSKFRGDYRGYANLRNCGAKETHIFREELVSMCVGQCVESGVRRFFPACAKPEGGEEVDA